MATKKLFFIFSILLSMVGTKALAYDIEVKNEDGVNIYYNYINDGKELEVTYGKGICYSGSVVIPEEVTYMNRTRKVTSIGFYAFQGCSGLTSVTIPNSVTRIGDHAFRECSGMTSVHISDLKAWCRISFSYPTSNPLRYAHHMYMNGDEITNLVIPNSVTSIGSYAFYGCSDLISVTIPNSVTNIGFAAFKSTGWYNNQSDGILYLDNWILGIKGNKPTGQLTISDGTKGLAEQAFASCSGLTSVTIPNSVTIMGNGAFSCCYALTSVTIPNSVKSIGDGAFYDCYALTSVTIPNSVTSIGPCAFYDCYGLTSATIGNSVTSIGEYAFSCCGLTSLTIGNSVTSIGVGAFRGCSGLTSLTIPNSVTSIGENAFWYCTGLNSLTIPNSVTSIGIGAFSECSGLTSVMIGNSVTSIGNNTFWCCTGLTSVIIPNSVTSIGYYAFQGCSGLTSVTIPNSVTSIENWSFDRCNLQEVISNIETPFDINTSTFSDNTFHFATLYVPSGSIEKYRAAEGWNKFVFIKEDSPTSIYNIERERTNEFKRYTLDGRIIKNSHKGINIIQMKNGSTQKVLVK